MSFEQPSLQPESGREALREALARKIEAMNALQAKAALMDIDEIDLRPDAIDAQAHLMTDVFTAAEQEPEAFLEVAGQVSDPETRRDLMAKAAVAIGARGDAMAFEAAVETYKENLRSSSDFDEEMIESNTGPLRMEAVEKRMAALVDAGDVAEAARTYSRDYRKRWGRSSVLENRIAGPMQTYIGEGEDLDERLERYNQMPDDFPAMGPDDFTVRMYRDEAAALPPDMPWEERKAHLREAFAQAPDILARISINRYLKGWDEKDRAALFKQVRDGGNRESVLSYFLAYDFTPEDFQELKPDLFAAYRKFRPDAILDRVGAFADEFGALPEEERKALVDGWIRQAPEMLVYRLSKTLQLDEEQRTNVFDHVIKDAPARLTDPEFTGKLGWDEKRIAARAVETGMAPTLLRQAGGLSDGTVTTLINHVVADPPRDFTVDFYPLLERGVELEPGRVQQGLQKLFAAGRSLDLMSLESASGIKLDVASVPEQALRGLKLTRIRAETENHPGLKERLPMAGLLSKLEKIQGRASRAEHDPWTQELDPLLAKAYEEGFLSPESPEDAELFLEFVKEFGAVDTPKLFETYAGLKRAKSLEEIPEGVRKMLEESLGAKRVAKMKTPAFLLNEVRKFDRGLVSSLLEDEIPEGLTSELGLELFDQKKGGSNWEQDDDPKELIEKWRRFAESSPERASVPEGYEEVRMAVPLMDRRAAGKDPKLTAILERPDARESFDGYVERFRHADPFDTSNDRLVETFIEAHPEAAEFGEAWRGAPGQVKKAHERLVEMMEALRADESPEAARLLTLLSAEHAWIVAPPGHAASFAAVKSDDAFSPNGIARMRSLLVDYVAEHYLHPSQETHRTGHEPFSPELRAALEKSWGLADKDANPVIKAFNDIEALKKNAKKSGKTKEVALVPAQGLLRVYGGDIADACYTSRHNELADGKYPDLHAMTFVTGRGTANERLAGSVLFVEAETPAEAGGKKVLVVRANNPRENLIQDVDAEALVRQTLDAAVAVAKARGLDMVVVPLDAASTSSSNRPAVSDYYEENFSDAEKVPLARKSETNFNGYANWDAEGEHAVVKVWSREEEEPG